jgi:phosphatidylglycerophosphate synthase
MDAPWVLVLEPPRGNPHQRIGGLPIALRLAFDAQAAGASAIVVGQAADGVSKALADPRLRLPVLSETPPNARELRFPASSVVHRATFRGLDARQVPWGFEPIEVVDRESARRAERLLFRSLRKPQDGWTSRWLNRPISLRVSRLLVKTPLTPNQVSALILAVGLAGAFFASRGGYWNLLVGAALFHGQSVLDGCDGEMSRVTHRGSLLGEWLDTIGDDLTNYSFFAGAAWGLYRADAELSYLVAGAVTVGCGVIASGLEYRYLARIGSGDLLKYPLSAGTATTSGWFSAVQPLFKRDTFVFLTLVAAALGLVGPMLFVFSVAAVGILTGVISAEFRMLRERRAMGAAR